MTSADGRVFPSALGAVARVDLPYRHDGDVDYEPYDEFVSAEQTRGWWQAWTGNTDLDGGDFRVFGQDGTGGMVAFWLERPGRPLVDQPVVFFGSEGERGVVASDLANYLWLLADGSGPHEAVAQPHRASCPNPTMVAIAERFAPDARRSAAEVISTAREEFPDFERAIGELCR